MPARLINSPKAYVYTKDQAGVSHNFTTYVVSGQVQRKINQVSTATVTLRNPYKIFTTPSTGVAFHPMDPITIYLERVQGFPVRVFTGYLDTTPYYQMYPGTITLQASCTLKRLLYTYFDPSLPSVLGLFTAQGWTLTESGTIISGTSLNSDNPTTQAEVNAGKLPFTALQDGSLGKMLWSILYNVGEWSDSNIYIEKLPDGAKGIAARMAALISSLQDDQKQAAADFTYFLSNIIGTGSQGSGGGPAGGGTASGSVSGGKQIVETVQPIADKYNIPLEMVLAVMDIETGFNNKDTAGNPHFGWFQVQTAAAPYAYGLWSHHVPTVAEAHDLGLSCAAFCSAAAGWVSNDPTLRNNEQQWAMDTQGVTGQNNPRYVTFWNTAISDAKLLISQYASKTGTNNSVGAAIQAGAAALPYFPLQKGTFVSQSSWTQDQGVDISTIGATCGVKQAPLLAIAAGTIVGHGISGFGADAPILRLDTPMTAQHYVYYGHAGPEGAVPIGTPVKAGQVIGSVGCGIVGISSGPHLEIGFSDANGTPVPGTSDLMLQVLRSAQAGQPVPGDGTTGGSSGSVSSSNTAQAFIAELQFPSMEDRATAIALSANHRGLMHDQALMPFIQQVCQASLRSFQSLPSGDFYAFYPDYFGEMGHRKPYWYIRDIEILSGGINLTDDALATHVFAVGDNTFLKSGIAGGGANTNAELIDMLLSTGAINIFNAFVGSGIVDNSSNSKTAKTGEGLSPGIMGAEEAVKFLQRYGARPLVQDYPMVRSSLFEMLLAYQQFMLAWSNQFKTPFTFTFMPELFPGGKVGFPDHGIQMYISSVTHEWNCEEGGFTTSAELSAPSVLEGFPSPDIPPHMVSALIEPLRSAPPGDPKQVTQQKVIAQAVATADQGAQQAINAALGAIGL